jgi:hypothetical protein
LKYTVIKEKYKFCFKISLIFLLFVQLFCLITHKKQSENLILQTWSFGTVDFAGFAAVMRAGQ